MQPEVVILVEASELRSDAYQIVSSHVRGEAEHAFAETHAPTQKQTSRNRHGLCGGGSNAGRLCGSAVAPHWGQY